jgi:hypothetical protein
VDVNGVETRVTRKLTENLPKKLVFRVPSLPASAYSLKVVTRFSSASHLLNEPRAITYDFPLIIPQPQSPGA